MRYFSLSVLIFVVATIASAPAMAQDRIGKIKIASGDVLILRDGGEIAAEPGTELFATDVITTGENSAVGMTFEDNARISMGPESKMTLERFQASGTPAFDVRLTEGSLTATSGAIAKARPLAMRVLTPTTVLGVKGTLFAVRVADI